MWRRARPRRPLDEQRFARAFVWLRDARLPPRYGALAGGVAGVLVGVWIAWGMKQHQVFSGPYQISWITAGAALVLLWLCIGMIGGLTVLSPEESPAAEAAEPGTEDRDGAASPPER